MDDARLDDHPDHPDDPVRLDRYTADPCVPPTLSGYVARWRPELDRLGRTPDHAYCAWVAGAYSTTVAVVRAAWGGAAVRAPVRTTARVPSSAVSIVDRARAYLAQIPLPEIGSGSDAATLYAACRLVRGFALSESEAEDLLWNWCGDRPGWTRNWVAAKVRHATRYGTEPMGGLL